MRPSATYEAPERVEAAGEGLVVRFAGRDGRSRDFHFAELAVAGMRVELAAAFAVRIGHTGTLNTLPSAYNAWTALRRFIGFLATLATAPATTGEITPTHLRRFRLHRLATVSEVAVMAEMRRVCRVLAEVPAGRLRPDTRAHLTAGQYASSGVTGHVGVPGYCDEVFGQIMRAARSDVARIRDRIRAGERLLARGSAGQTAPQDAETAALLAAMADTGEVPMRRFAGSVAPDQRARMDQAGRLFLIGSDLAPLMVLGVGLSGRNGETIKELPAEHHLLDQQAVQLRAVKRRRGAGQWFADVVWEIGQPSRQLHTPGGFYLLLLELTARSRTFSGSRTAWSVWLGGQVKDGLEGGGHVDPFAASLTRRLHLNRWARRHGLREDEAPLRLTMNRLKTTVERRTTRSVGGHLPSAARTNTQEVLFASYLAGDPTVRDWAEDLMSEAVADAETAARRAHRRALEAGGGRLPVVETDEVPPESRTATAFASCTGITDSPFNTGTCRASFLACFACRNAVVTAQHLPSLLDLQDEVEARWATTAHRDWWARYGQAWLAITEDVLPRFTPAEIDDARRRPRLSASVLLDLLEGPTQTA